MMLTYLRYWAGERALSTAIPQMLSRCIVNGAWQCPGFAFELVSYAFSVLRIHPRRASVIVAVPDPEDTKEINLIQKYFFRIYRTPTLSIFPAASLTLCYHGVDSGMVLSLGHDLVSLSLYGPSFRLIKCTALRLSLQVEQVNRVVRGYGGRDETVKGRYIFLQHFEISK